MTDRKVCTRCFRALAAHDRDELRACDGIEPLGPRSRTMTSRLVADTRRTAGRARLDDLEEMVLDIRRDRTHMEQPSKRLPSRMQNATNRWSVAASQVAVGLTSATVGSPPQRPDRTGVRAGVSDPTAATVDATLHHVEASAVRFVHLSTPCALDGEHNAGDGRCPGPHAVDLGDHADVHLDVDDLADNVLGSTTSTAGWAKAVHELASWHSKTSVMLKARFDDGYAGRAPQIAETSALEAWVTATEDLGRRLDRLAGELAQWSGRSERRCACGCGGKAPEVGQGATAEACRQRRSRARRQAG